MKFIYAKKLRPDAVEPTSDDGKTFTLTAFCKGVSMGLHYETGIYVYVPKGYYFTTSYDDRIYDDGEIKFISYDSDDFDSDLNTKIITITLHKIIDFRFNMEVSEGVYEYGRYMNNYEYNYGRKEN